MRNREKISYIVDSFYAIIQTVLFAIIPVLFDNGLIQIILYVSFLFLQLLYLYFLRKYIVDMLSHPGGISTEYLLQANCGICFRSEIITKINEMKELVENKGLANQTNTFDEYAVYLKWKDAADYVVQHFWDGKKTKNTTSDSSNIFLPQNIYMVELMMVVSALINIFKFCNDFNGTKTLFNNHSFTTEVDNLNKSLENMMMFCKNSSLN